MTDETEQYTPTLDEGRGRYSDGAIHQGVHGDHLDAFDRLIAQVRRDALDQAEARIKAVRALHEPDWHSLPCPDHPIKGCGRGDCKPTGTTFTGATRYRHEHGFASCLGCNAVGYCEDPVEWPCATIRALDG